MALHKKIFDRWNGVVSSIDETKVPENFASDLLNVIGSDLFLKIRSGWSEIQSAPASFAACYGFFLLTGRSSSAELREYVTIQTISGNTRPYRYDIDGSNRTEILEGGANVNLTAGEFGKECFDSVGYFFRIGGSEGGYKHDITDDDDFEPIDVSRPSDVSVANVSFDNTEDNDTTLSTESWSGASGSNLLEANDAGAARGTTFDSVVGDAILLDIFVNSGTEATWVFKLQLVSTPVDWSTMGKLTFVINYPLGDGLSILPENTTVKIGDTVSDELSLEVTATKSEVGTGALFVEAVVPDGTDMSDYDDTDWIEIGVTSVSGAITSTLTVNEIFPVETGTGTGPSASADKVLVRLGLVYYDSLRDVESENVTPSSYFYLDAPNKWFSNPDEVFMGTIPVVDIPTPAESYADQARLYVEFDEERIWRLVTTVDVSDGEVECLHSQSELEVKPARVEDLGPNPIGALNCATTYLGWMVWGRSTGKSNICHSYIGNPLRISREDDDVQDTTRGATFTLADDFADAPIWMGEAGRTLIILGSRGGYAQTGNSPSTMTPPAKMASLKGVCGPRAATEFRTAVGNPGVAYISNTFSLFFIVARQVDSTGQFGHSHIELGEPIRGEIESFLGNGSSINTNQLILSFDERGDMLWIIYKDRAIVLSAERVLENTRDFLKFEFTHDGSEHWTHLAQDETSGMRILRSTGEIDDLYYDSSNDYAKFEGTGRDNGSEPSSPFWEHKTTTPYKRRVNQVEVDKVDADDVIVTRLTVQSGSYDMTSKAGKRFSIGRDHRVNDFEISYKIILPDNCSGIRRVIATETIPTDGGLIR